LGVTASVASILLAPAPIHAQNPGPSQLVRTGVTFSCVDYELCDLGDSCDSGELSCETLPTGDNGCSPSTGGRQDLICCDSGDDCGMVDGMMGACIGVGTTGVRVCIYPGTTVFGSCISGDAITLELARQCWVSPDDGEPASWKDGDCDGDLLPNGTDPCPCDHDNGCTGTLDLGGTVDLGGTPDLGGTMDMGTAPDANAADDSVGVRGVSFTGDGGCAVGRFERSGPTTLLLVGLALLLARRRAR
jgi:hypothetical protein